MGPRRAFLLTIFLLVFLTIETTSGSISGPHWIPEAPVEGEEITIFVPLTFEDTENITGAKLLFDDLNLTLNRYNGTSTKNDTILYSCSFVPEENGTYLISVLISYNGEWNNEGSFPITILNDDDDDNSREDDTIFGLPKWYCSISVLLMTVVVIFLTWSYFKGKSIQRSREMTTGAISIECSECGKPVDKDERFCRWCGSELESEEFVCGKCGQTVDGKSKTCPHCGTSLLSARSIQVGDRKHEVNERIVNRPSRKERRNIQGKWECAGCGAVLMENEIRCPVCGKVK
jgi:RNA polymerase subunit RPABC4/transcription elongation factor Spt4